MQTLNPNFYVGTVDMDETYAEDVVEHIKGGKFNFYVWVRGDKENEYEMDLSDVPSVFTSGTLDPEKLEEGVGKTIVDLSGCTLDEVLYFVSHDRPVLANTKEGVKCIVGYDEYNTYLLNPGEDEWYYYGIQDSTDLFLAAGNEFYSYIEK